jgi:hypothetical protein
MLMDQISMLEVLPRGLLAHTLMQTRAVLFLKRRAHLKRGISLTTTFTPSLVVSWIQWKVTSFTEQKTFWSSTRMLKYLQERLLSNWCALLPDGVTGYLQK